MPKTPDTTTDRKKLVRLGYRPLPILSGEKRPAIKRWQELCDRSPTLPEIQAWAEQFPDAGTGIACGNVVAVDIDIYDGKAALAAQDAAETALGETPLLRVGQEPKRLLVYRADGPIRSEALTIGTDSTDRTSGIEILSKGRQFVALAIHPVTRKPYQWTRESILDVSLEALPKVDQAAIDAFMDPYRVGKTPRRREKRAAGSKPNLAEVSDALRVLRDDAHWWEVLVSVQDAIEDDETAWELFWEWVRSFPGEHSERDTRGTWFRGRRWDDPRAEDRITVGTLLGLARDDARARFIAEADQLKHDAPLDDVEDLLLTVCWARPTELELAEVISVLKDKTGRRFTAASIRAEVARINAKYRRATDVATLDRFIWIVAIERFLDAKTGELLSREQLRDAWAHVTDDLAKQLLVDTKLTKVDAPTYRPGLSRLIDAAPLSLVNLWIPPDLEPRRGDPTLWLDHVKFIVADDYAREDLIDWIAFNVQHPEIKINYAVFLGGGQGIGKDLMFEPLLRAIGTSNYRYVMPNDIKSGYTGWLRGTKLIVVQEMMSFGRREIADHLKPLIATPPDKLTINEKYLAVFEIPNVASFIFMSNREDALILERDDRRFWTYWSSAEKRAGAYYVEMFNWVAAHSDVVLDFLLERDLGGFNPRAAAPDTEFKKALIEESRPLLEQQLAAALDNSERPMDGSMTTSSAVLRWASINVSRNITATAVGRALRGIGAAALGQVPVGEGRAAQRAAAWAIRHVELLKKLKPAELREVLAHEASRRERGDARVAMSEAELTGLHELREPGDEEMF